MTAPHYHHAVIDSTNSEAFRQAEKGAPHGTAITADFQTAGRGQPGRVWWMPEGKGIMLSVLLRQMPGGIAFEDLTLAVGGTLAKFLANETGLPLDVKLPNDLMIRGKKVGGVLCEARWKNEELIAAVIGVGINVNVAEFPPEIAETATSLMREAGRAFDLPQLRAAMIECLRAMKQGVS